MMISPCRSAKWRGTSFQPAAPKKNGTAEVEDQRGRPEDRLAAAADQRPREQQPDADRGAHLERPDRLAQVGVVAAGQQEERDMGGTNDPVGDRELDREVAVGLRDADRGDQQAGHRREHRDSHRVVLGVETLVSQA